MTTTEEVTTTQAVLTTTINITDEDVDGNFTSSPGPEEPKFIFIILYTIAIVLSMVGNILVIIVFSLGKRSRTDLRGFLISLAISDLIMALFCMPFSFTSALLRQWIFPWFLCPIVVFMQTTSVTASVCTNMAIGIDRFWVVTFPLRSRLKKSRYKVMITTIWVISISLSVVLLYIATVRDYGNGRYQCGENWPSEDLRRAYTIFIFILTYLLPLCMLTFTYTFVGRRLWQRTTPGNADEVRDTQQLKSKRKVIKMLVVVVVLFGICWLPLHLFQFVMDFASMSDQYRASHRTLFNMMYFTFHWLAMSNSFVNPIIYGFMNDSFRNDLRHLLFRFCPCCRCLFRGRLAFSSSPSERMFSHYTIDNERRSSTNSAIYRFDSSRNSSRRNVVQNCRIPNGHGDAYLTHHKSLYNKNSRGQWIVQDPTDHRLSVKSHHFASQRGLRSCPTSRSPSRSPNRSPCRTPQKSPSRSPNKSPQKSPQNSLPTGPDIV